MSIANTPADISPADAAVFPRDEVIAEPTKRWTVAEYHELIRQGFLTEDDPYELIEGWLVQKMTKNSPHNAAVLRLTCLFATKLDLQQWIFGSQNSLTLPDGEPEPDLVILPGPSSRYDTRNPLGSEAALVIEVSDASLLRDRGIKLRSYARAGIPQYWIVNLRDRQVEAYSQPVMAEESARYENMTAYPAGVSVPVIVEGQTLFQLLVDDILPAVT